MFGADAKALFAKYCLDIRLYLLKKIFAEGQKSIFSMHCPAHLNYIPLTIVFGFCYKLSNFLTIIDRYYAQLSSNWPI